MCRILNKYGATTTNSNSNILCIISHSDQYTQPTVMQAICSAAHFLTTENCPCYQSKTAWSRLSLLQHTMISIIIRKIWSQPTARLPTAQQNPVPPHPLHFKSSQALCSPQDLSHPLNDFTQIASVHAIICGSRFHLPSTLSMYLLLSQNTFTVPYKVL